ncbi:hypothetical protein CLV87_0855 [Pelagimonas phthalicica]|nr:hypothetical protein CLV87_0855 [Pelagimonas phthalicica]
MAAGLGGLLQNAPLHKTGFLGVAIVFGWLTPLFIGFGLLAVRKRFEKVKKGNKYVTWRWALFGLPLSWWIARSYWGHELVDDLIGGWLSSQWYWFKYVAIFGPPMALLLKLFGELQHSK